MPALPEHPVELGIGKGQCLSRGGWTSAHVMGVSLGSALAQGMALLHPGMGHNLPEELWDDLIARMPT